VPISREKRSLPLRTGEPGEGGRDNQGRGVSATQMFNYDTNFDAKGADEKRIGRKCSGKEGERTKRKTLQ